MQQRDYLFGELKQAVQSRKKAHQAYTEWLNTYDPLNITQDQIRREQDKEASLRTNLALCERKIIQLAEELVNCEQESSP